MIVRSSGDDRDLEGCLSIPGYVAYVTRREKVWVVAQNRVGKHIKVAGSGLLGRALQHELDHLDGKLYIDYLDSMDELIEVGGGEGDDDDVREAASPWRDRARTLFLGSGAFGIPAFRALADHPSVELVGVVTAPPRPVGRRQTLTPTPLAAAIDLPVPRSSSRLGCARRRRWPRSWPWSRVRGPRRLWAARPGADPGAPARRAEPASVAAAAASRCDADPATILAGDATTGVTLMRMDAGLDTGPIVGQERRRLDGDETARSSKPIWRTGQPGS